MYAKDPKELLEAVLAFADRDPSQGRCLGHERPGFPHFIVSHEFGDPSTVHVSAVAHSKDTDSLGRLVRYLRDQGIALALYQTHVRQFTDHLRFPRPPA